MFALENGQPPRLAAVGRPQTAFAGPPRDTGADAPAAGANIGRFFLTDDGVLQGLTPPPLIVTYNPPAADASGVILDLDFDETMTIEARDGGGRVLSSLVLRATEPGTGDGVATRWAISHPTADIASIRFTGRRTAAGSFGLGFDMFCARGRTSGTSLQLSLDASVLFDFDKALVKPEAVAAVRAAATQIASHPPGRILIEGHTDNVGAEAYNDQLSRARAQAVADLLRQSGGLEKFAIEVVGYGARRPLTSNATEADRQRNRRVDIAVLTP